MQNAFTVGEVKQRALKGTSLGFPLLSVVWLYGCELHTAGNKELFFVSKAETTFLPLFQYVFTKLSNFQLLTFLF